MWRLLSRVALWTLPLAAAAAACRRDETSGDGDGPRPADEDGGLDGIPDDDATLPADDEDGTTGPRDTYRTAPGRDDLFATIPCLPADLRVIQERIVGLCSAGTGGDNRIFRVNPRAASRTIPAELAADLPDDDPELAGVPMPLSFLTPLPDGEALVSAEVGFFSGWTGAPFTFFRDQADWPRLGQPFAPNHPGGGLVVGTRLFLPVANWDFEKTSQSGGSPVFAAGGVVVYELDGNQRPVLSNPRYIAAGEPQGINPTGMAALDDHTVLVLFNNAARAVTPELKRASLAVIDTTTEKISRTLDLGTEAVAGLHGEIALDANRQTAILGTSDNSGRVLFADLATGQVDTVIVSRPDGVAESFLSAIAVLDGTAYALDYNSGWLTPIPLATRQPGAPYPVLDIPPAGDGGRMAVWQDSLLVPTRAGKLIQLFPQEW